MQIITILAGLTLGMLCSCSGNNFVRTDAQKHADEKSEQENTESKDISPSEQEANFISSEPVPVAGAFLYCAFLHSNKSALGCRLEDQTRTKVALSSVAADDIFAKNPTGERLNVAFVVAPAESVWHWNSAGDLSSIEIGQIELSSNYVLDSAQNYISSVATVPEVVVPADTAVNVQANATPVEEEQALAPATPTSPAPPTSIFEFAVQNAVKETVDGAVNYWFQGSAPNSCVDFCANRGGLNETLTSQKTSNHLLCHDAMKILYPNIQKVASTENAGISCFTKGAGSNVVLYTENVPVYNKDAKGAGIRPLCICNDPP